VPAPAADDLERNKAQLQVMNEHPATAHFHADIPQQYGYLKFPPLPTVAIVLTPGMATRYCNVDHLMAVIEDHLQAQESQNLELMAVGQQLQNLREDGMVEERHTVALQHAVIDHLMSHRKHDWQMVEVRFSMPSTLDMYHAKFPLTHPVLVRFQYGVGALSLFTLTQKVNRTKKADFFTRDTNILQVMRRLMDPNAAGIVDSGVTAEDNARATLLTAIDFMILDDTMRARIVHLLDANELEQAQVRTLCGCGCRA
jgi:hypothetical protein